MLVPVVGPQAATAEAAAAPASSDASTGATAASAAGAVAPAPAPARANTTAPTSGSRKRKSSRRSDESAAGMYLPEDGEVMDVTPSRGLSSDAANRRWVPSCSVTLWITPRCRQRIDSAMEKVGTGMDKLASAFPVPADPLVVSIWTALRGVYAQFPL